MISLHNKTRGFTLIEMIVSIGLFTIVLFIASSAFLSVVSADRKSRATRLAMDNLTVALEDMTRRLKTGYDYSCGNVGRVNNCLEIPLSTIAFTDQNGERTIYSLSSGSIFRDIASEGGGLPVTSPEINISSLSFAVGGTSPADDQQPYVKIFIEGETGGGVADAKFSLQTMVTQRVYDI